MVFVDNKLPVLCVVASDPLQGSINRVLGEMISHYFQHPGQPFNDHQKTFSLY